MRAERKLWWVRRTREPVADETDPKPAPITFNKNLFINGRKGRPGGPAARIGPGSRGDIDLCAVFLDKYCRIQC